MLSFLSRFQLMAAAAGLVLGLAGLAGTLIQGSRLKAAKAELAMTVLALNTSEANRKVEAAAALRSVAALEARAADTASRAVASTAARIGVNRAKPSNACSTSPAIRALLDGVRRPGSDHRAGAPGHPAGKPTPLPPRPAAAPRDR